MGKEVKGGERSELERGGRGSVGVFASS